MLRELLASFDVDTSNAASKLKSIDKAIETTKFRFGGLIEAFAGASFLHGVTSFVEGQIEMGSRLTDLSERLGVSTDELQRFQFAAGLSGVGSEEAAMSLKFLNKNIGEAIGGNKEAAQTFAKLGVATKDGQGNVRQLADVIPDVADAFAKLGSDQERTALATTLFGRQGAALLPVLKGGSGELKKLNAEFTALGGGMSKEFTKAADEAGDEISKLKFGLEGLKSRIAFAILPAVTDMARKFQDWTKVLHVMLRNTNLAKEAWVAFGIAGAAATAKMAVGFAKMLGVIPSGAGFWTSLLGLAEIALVVLGVAALFLIFEDLFTFLTGGKSLIGDLMNEFLGIGTADELVQSFRSSWALLSGLFATDIGQLGELTKIFDGLGKEVVPYLVGGLADVVRIIGGIVVGLGAMVKLQMQLNNLDFEGAKKTVEATAKNLFGEGGILSKSNSGEAIIAAKHRAMSRADADVTETLHTGGTGGMSAAIQQSNQTNITINGVKDAQGAGQAAKSGVNDALGGFLNEALGAAHGGG